MRLAIVTAVFAVLTGGGCQPQPVPVAEPAGSTVAVIRDNGTGTTVTAVPVEGGTLYVSHRWNAVSSVFVPKQEGKP